jgi:hypothetical protein
LHTVHPGMLMSNRTASSFGSISAPGKRERVVIAIADDDVYIVEPVHLISLASHNFGRAEAGIFKALTEFDWREL